MPIPNPAELLRIGFLIIVAAAALVGFAAYVFLHLLGSLRHRQLADSFKPTTRRYWIRWSLAAALVAAGGYVFWYYVIDDPAPGVEEMLRTPERTT